MPNSAINPGQAVVEYALIVPDRNPIILNSGVMVHQHSALHDSIYGPATYSHRIRTTTTEFIDNEVKQAMASGTGRLRFRLGVGTPDNMFWLPWQEHVITHYSALLESIGTQAGHIIEFETQDFMFLISRTTKTVARKGTVSKIVGDICQEWNLQANVVEPTTGDGAYIQAFIDDSKFIRERMIRRARNQKGRGNFLYYFKDSVLHFHSPDYQAEVHNVIYYQANSAALVQIDNSQRLIEQGNAGVEMTAYDPYTAQTKVLYSDPAKALRYSDSIYQISRIPGVQRQLSYHSGVNFQDEAEVIGQNVYEHARGETFNLSLEVDKTIQIRHGDFVNLVVQPADEKASPWSGFYLVTEVKHVVQKGAVRSLYTLARGEIRKSLRNLTASTGQDILVNEQEAPGQPLNIPEIKSSQRTKGAGKLAADGRLYTTVQSPN